MQGRILIVEDDAINASFISNILTRELNVVIVVVHTLGELFSNLQNGQFDVVVSGLYYSVGNHDNAFRDILQSIKRLKIKTPIIFLSHHASPKDAFEAARLGGFDFLTWGESNTNDFAPLINSVKSAIELSRIPNSHEEKLEKYVSALLTTMAGNFEEIKQILGSGFYDIKRSQAIIHNLISKTNYETLMNIQESIKLARIEQSEILRTLDAIRRVLKILQSTTSVNNEQTREIITNANAIIESNLGIQQKVELTLPIIPYFLDYKFELATGSNANINALIEQIKQQWQVLERNAEEKSHS